MLVGSPRSTLFPYTTLFRSILGNGQIADRVQCGRIIHRIDSNGEGAHNGIIARPAIVDRHGDSRSAGGEGSRSQTQGSARVGTGIVDRGIGNQARITGGSRQTQSLNLVGSSRADAGEIDRKSVV